MIRVRIPRATHGNNSHRDGRAALRSPAAGDEADWGTEINQSKSAWLVCSKASSANAGRSGCAEGRRAGDNVPEVCELRGSIDQRNTFEETCWTEATVAPDEQ